MNIKNILFFLTFICFGVSHAQTPVAASVNAAGWKRVAYCKGSAGRGFGKVTIYTTGGALAPYQLDIEWFKDWATIGGVSVKSNSKSAMWSQARLTYDKDTTFIEVNFTRELTGLAILSDTYGWNTARPFSGVLPNGGGTVRAEARVGKLAIDNYLTVTYDGKVGIGTASPSEKLSVDGTIRAKEIKVEAGPWPDYVFENGYKLPSVDEIRSYISEHGHLEGVPSASNVAKEGISIGEMNVILLKKIEELTLLLIKKDDELQVQKQAITELGTEMEKVKKILKDSLEK